MSKKTTVKPSNAHPYLQPKPHPLNDILQSSITSLISERKLLKQECMAHRCQNAEMQIELALMKEDNRVLKETIENLKTILQGNHDLIVCLQQDLENARNGVIHEQEVLNDELLRLSVDIDWELDTQTVF